MIKTFSEENPAGELLESMVRNAVEAGASDIHLQRAGEEVQIEFRIDGLLLPVKSVGSDLAERLFGRIKYLARLKTYQDSMPQDGRIEKASLGIGNDVRVSTYPAVAGEKIVLRLFQSQSRDRLEDLGFGSTLQQELTAFLRGNSGLLLLTGPAGSGKTTTIYTCLNHLQKGSRRQIITVEDPVEQILPGVMQTEISEARGLTFSKSIRHLLRHDPEVLVIGEIRDEETAGRAVRAALTGHLVLSTLHAGSARGVVERMMNMVPDHYALFSCLGLILNQRLVRLICQACSVDGCPACWQSGFRGRLPITEWGKVDDSLRAALRERGASALVPVEDLKASAEKLLRAGETDRRELERMGLVLS